MALFNRRLVMGVLAALALAACDASGGAGSSGGGAFERPGDMAIGSPDAPLTIIEYASATCPHCATWHDQVWPVVKSEYVETGKVRFVFREFPTAPAQLSAGSFLLARCGGANADQYFQRLGTIFDEQAALIGAYQRGTAREELLRLASDFGLSAQQFETCVRDDAGYTRINETVEHGVETYRVTGTPAFVINGELVTEVGAASPDGIRAILDDKLSQHGG